MSVDVWTAHKRKKRWRPLQTEGFSWSWNIQRKKLFCQWVRSRAVANSPDVVGQNRSQALFRKPLCIFRGNKCGLEGSRHHRSRLVRVSLSYSLATVETPQDRKMGSGMTACSKLRYPNKLPVSMVWFSPRFSCEIATKHRGRQRIHAAYKYSCWVLRFELSNLQVWYAACRCTLIFCLRLAHTKRFYKS